MNNKEFSVNKIDLADYKNINPTRTCYSIRTDTKKRLDNAVKDHAILNASMVVDLAVNMFLNDLENQNLELVVSLLPKSSK